MEQLCKLYLELSTVVPQDTKTWRDLEYERAIRRALIHLDGATPKQRNGPVYQAADTLRALLGLPPMRIGGKPSDGLLGVDKSDV